MASGTFAGLDWSVYSGAALTAAARPTGWLAAPCSTDQLGGLLHDTGEPVVVLGGRAELGPRALGHRSILASPASASVKRVLNEVKGSEDYRPVAPMCLEQFAAEIFEPGGPDPYMLFDHPVRSWWAGRIPAVIHVDGTARLQTVNDRDAPLAAAVVRAFWQRSVGYTGSVHHQRQPPGRGFFPDAASAMEWGGVRRVWADGTLFTKAGDP
jgi:carbamoyltransferase